MSERPRLLIVDDDREIRGLLGQYLDKHDFRTTAVADGKEMRRVMERSHVDLLVLDLMLPGEDGLSLCRELRSRSQVPIIMLTARRGGDGRGRRRTARAPLSRVAAVPEAKKSDTPTRATIGYAEIFTP